MASTRDHAVVLRCWDFSETSQTVAMLARDTGMIRGLAKGARRISSRFGGGFEPLTRGEIAFIIKPSSELATLTEWDLQEVFWAPRRDLWSHHAAMFLADATFHAVLDHDAHPLLYDALVVALRALEDPAQRAACLPTFLWSLLTEAGYQPRVSLEQTDGGPAPPPSGSRRRAEYFDSRSGGVIEAPEESRPGVWRVREQTMDVLRALESGAGARAPGIDDAALLRAGRLLTAYLRAVLDRELVTARAVFGLMSAETGPDGARKIGSEYPANNA